MPVINQRYRLHQRLGQGASGSVFLAEDLLYDNASVALKVIPASRMSGSGFQDVRQEFFTLNGLDHPNLVQALDFGTIITADEPFRQGDHFLSYEYVEGENLFTATSAFTWQLVKELSYQVLQTLDFLHRHSLIHFDVKPENILVVSGSMSGTDVRLAKLIDFGFSSMPVGADARSVRGTLAYIAPELLATGHADLRADLYSFGISLYQIITRTLPDDSVATVENLKRRLTEPARRPSLVRSDVPSVLDDLVAALTEPDPDQRIGSAMEAAKHLESTLERGHLMLPYYRSIRPSTFVGREKELLLITNNLRQATPRARAVSNAPLTTPILISGPEGIGKTRLLREARREAQALDILFLEARCVGTQDRAFAPIPPVLREMRYRLELRGGPGSAIREAGAILRLLSEGAEDVQDSDPSSLRFRIMERIALFFAEFAARTPFAIWFDDIELADEATADLVTHLAFSSAHGHFVVLLSTSVTDQTKLRGYRADEHGQVVLLKEFSLDESLRFARHMSAIADLREEDIAPLSQQIGTAPGTLGQMLAHALRLHDQTPGSSFSHILRDIAGTIDLKDQYRQRFETLAQDEQDCLRLLSCFHIPVELSLLYRLLSFSHTRTRQALTRLTNEGLIAPAAYGSVYFAHEQFRRFVYERLQGMCVLLHRHIAEAFERAYPGKLGDHAEELAFHYHRSGNLPRAYTHYRIAARKEQGVSSYRRSAEFLELALAIAPTESDRDAVREHLAEVSRALSEFPKAEALYLQLLDHADTRERRLTLHRSLGSIQTLLGHLDAAEQSLKDASHLAVTPSELDEVQLDHASVQISKGDYVAARRLLEALLDREQELEGPKLRGAVFNRLGIVEFYENKLEAARRRFSESVDALGTDAAPDQLISPLLNLGNVHSFQGDFAKAEECWKQALTLTKKACNINLEARIYNNLGIAEFSREQYSAAADYYGRAIRTFTRLGNRPGQALCLTNIGEVHLAVGAYEEALDVWRSNLALYESLDDNQGIAEVSIHLAHALIMLGDLPGAEQRLATASRLISDAGLTTPQGICDLIQSMLELERGNNERARESVRKAEQFFMSAQDWRNVCLSRLTRGRASLLCGNRPGAANAYRLALTVARDRGYRILRAEALLGLSITAGMDRAEGLAHPLSYLKEAVELFEDAPMVETTWRVSLALGDAYRRRGLRAKAESYLRNAADTVTHLASRFKSAELRERFLSTHGRGEPMHLLEILNYPSPSS
jgi:serine/threonine protein kinase/tetratricopeptide (TPR) repeat protein